MGYPVGQCTYYVAGRYPGMPQDMGNGKDWLASARRYGFAQSNQPRRGWVAVYGPSKVSSFGHVAIVEKVNNDGTFDVSEMNWRAWNVIDQRTSTMDNVEGFFMPPGAAEFAMPTGMAVETATSSSSGDNLASGLLGTLLNAGLVLGGAVLMVFGAFLATFSQPQAAAALESRQQGQVKAKTEQARQDMRRNRAVLREAKKPKIVEGVRPPRKTRAERVNDAIEKGRTEAERNRVERSAEEERAMRGVEIPF